MKNILFDLRASQPYGGTKFHGGGQYCRAVFHELVKCINTLSCVYDSSLYIDPEVEQICKERNIKMFDLSKLDFQTIINENHFDLYYSALPAATQNKQYYFGDCLYLGTIHGLRTLELKYDKYELIYPYNYNGFLKHYLNKYLPSLLEKRTINQISKLFAMPQFKCIVVSEHTKSSLISFFPGLKSDGIKVYYSPTTSLKTDNIRPYSEDKYWLMVNGNRWTKNVYRGLLAFDSLFTDRQDIKGKVIVTGVGNSRYFYKKLKNKSRFEFINYVSDYDLACLYCSAYSLVYPSLNEGFGYPPIEAMRFGKPVLASCCSSIPEVCDNAAIYFNPLVISEIKNRIIQLENNEIYNLYSQRSIKRYKEITLRQDEDLKKMIDYILNIKQ